ncbi:hypothetical protein, partial [Rickettsia sp. R1]
CDSISDTNFSIAGFDTLLLFFILAPCKLFMLFLFLTIFTTYTNFLTPSINIFQFLNALLQLLLHMLYQEL